MLLIDYGVNGDVRNKGGFKPADLINDDVIKAQFKVEMVILPKHPFHHVVNTSTTSNEQATNDAF